MEKHHLRLQVLVCFTIWHAYPQFNPQWINAASLQEYLHTRACWCLLNSLQYHYWYNISICFSISLYTWSTPVRHVKIRFLGSLLMHKQPHKCYIKLRRNKHWLGLLFCLSFPGIKSYIVHNKRPKHYIYFIMILHRYLLPYWLFRYEKQVTWTVSRLCVYWKYLAMQN